MVYSSCFSLENLGAVAIGDIGGWLPPSPRTKSATEVAIEQQKGRLQDASNTHTQQPEGPYPAHAINHHNNRKPEINRNQRCVAVLHEGG